ncbi:MAG: thiolase family protein [Bacillota bacterium]|nr:acetyl-CoA C-acyltransferase [Bacillota bacterium]
MPEAVIVAAVRTPVGKAGGLLRRWKAEDLAAWMLRHLLERQAVRPGQVDELYLGNAVGGGGNVARLAWLVAGYPLEVPAVTVDRQCGSGLEAVIQASRQVICGAASAVVAGGVESVTNAPLRARKVVEPEPSRKAERETAEMAHGNTGGEGKHGGEAVAPAGGTSSDRGTRWEFYTRPPFSPPYLGDPDMGVAAEEVARRYGIAREEQDEWAMWSHRRALAAWEEGALAEVVCPLPPSPPLQDGRLLATDGPRSEWIERDEGPRKLTPRLAARAPAAFVPGGTVTAANSCGIHDGAAGVLIVAEDLARALGCRFGLRFRGAAAAGVDPNVPGMGPVPAIRRLLQQTGLRLDEVDLFEVNEPFAAPLLACQRELAIPPERLNVLGGALAYGHPYGATGAVLVCHLFAAMARRRCRFGVVALGIAGGLGLAALFERVAW